MFDTVVVMDHDLPRRQLLYRILSDVNYRVTTVPSAPELLECLKQERPRCVILAVPSDRPADEASVILRHVRDIDPQLKVVLLVPAAHVETLSSAARSDARLAILNVAMDQRDLIRSLLGVLKAREVERIDESTAFQGPILVIEDEPRIAQLLTDYLQRRGYKVTAVTNGEEALVQMQVLRPKIAILDILLPGMDGLLTLQQLKAKDPSVAVIVSSGFEDAALKQQAEALGACAYLVKPFDLAKLEAAILASTLPQSAKPDSPQPTTSGGP